MSYLFELFTPVLADYSLDDNYIKEKGNNRKIDQRVFRKVEYGSRGCMRNSFVRFPEVMDRYWRGMSQKGPFGTENIFMERMRT